MWELHYSITLDTIKLEIKAPNTSTLCHSIMKSISQQTKNDILSLLDCGESPTTVMWWAKSATCCHLWWQVLKCSLCHPTGMDGLNHLFPTAPVLQRWGLRVQHHVYTCIFTCTLHYVNYGGGERKKGSFFPPPYKIVNYGLLHGPGIKQ